MAVTSASAMAVNLKKGHFEHQENGRIDKKYTLADALPVQLSALTIQPPSMIKSSYSIRTLTSHHKESVLRFLRRFFFRDEPMNLAVNLLETPTSRCKELEEYAASTLEEEVSVAAVDEAGELVGVVINGIVRREDAGAEEKSDDCPNEKFSRILRVLGHLDKEAKIWEKLNASVTKMMEVRIVSTHSAWRGRGLMRVMCEESERLARENGVGAMRMDTTSAFSAAAAERLKYRQIYKVAYADLEYAPQPTAPHLEARVYIKEL